MLIQVAYLSKHNVQGKCQEDKEGFQGKDSFWKSCYESASLVDHQ